MQEDGMFYFVHIRNNIFLDRLICEGSSPHMHKQQDQKVLHRIFEIPKYVAGWEEPTLSKYCFFGVVAL